MPFRKCSHPNCKRRFFSASGSSKLCPKCRISEKQEESIDEKKENDKRARNNVTDDHHVDVSSPARPITAAATRSDDDLSLCKLSPTTKIRTTNVAVFDDVGSKEAMPNKCGEVIHDVKVPSEERQDLRQLQQEWPSSTLPSIKVNPTNEVCSEIGSSTMSVQSSGMHVMNDLLYAPNAEDVAVVSNNHHAHPPDIPSFHERRTEFSTNKQLSIKRCHSQSVKVLEDDDQCIEVTDKHQQPTHYGGSCSSSSSKDCKISDEKYECFVCGSDLSHLRSMKGRVNHIKRCGKKYSITARDVVKNDDEEIFVKMSNKRQKGGISSSVDAADHGASGGGAQIIDEDGLIDHYVYSLSDSNTPENDEWHEGAEKDLKCENGLKGSGSDPSASIITTTASTGKQTILSNFFQRPQRSLNDVLKSGARRLAKSAMITAKAKENANKSTSSANNFRKRGTWRRGWSSNNANSVVKACPSYKKITGTDFICDGFYYAKPSLSSNYFLTHFHSDHYGGITSSWNAGVIYCSLPTANLVSQQLGVDKKYLHPIAMLTPTAIESRGKAVTVTLIDANHCPGAVMFLFEVGNKRILHVGDFRWNRLMMMKSSPLQAFSSLRHRLDEIFLDTTYCNEKYVLPTQQSAIDETIRVVEEELAEVRPGKKKLFLFGSYTIGKERIYMAVAQHFRKKVYVDKRRYKILCALNWPREQIRLLTTDKSETNIWVVPLGDINFKRMRRYDEEASSNKVLSSGGYSHIVGFRPTGWSFSEKRTELIARRKSGRFVTYAVPYSEHSSFTELVDCLLCLKPKKIIPTVSVSKSAEQCELLLTAVRRHLEDHTNVDS